MYNYFSFVFSIVPKKVELLKILKVMQLLWKFYFSVSPSCTLFFFNKENIKFSEVALVVVHCNCLIGCIMNVRAYRPWNNANTTADTYFLVENGNKNTETKCKVFIKLINKCTRITDCRLASVFLALSNFHTS